MLDAMGEAIIRPLTRNLFESRPEAFVAIARDVPGEYWTVEHFRADLPMKWELSFAAWHDDVPIGYAILSSKTTVRAHLHHLMIGQGWRGTGIGSRLLDRACVRAAEHGHSAFTLKVAMDSPARRFYERHGFAPHGHENGYSVYRRSL